MTAVLQRDFFLKAAVEWMRLANSMRERYPAGEGPIWRAALGLWREAAWCHLLFAAGKHTLLLGRLRVVLAEVVGGRPDPPRRHDRAEVLATAADIFTLLRCAVSVRYPAAVGHPAA
jgi:hypothetical protein